jgi:hypothetical protein
MKTFIGKIILYLSIVTIIIVSFSVGIYFIQSKASFKLPPNKNILVVGDSHTQCSIDDNIFCRSVNVSQGGSAYFYSYCKIKKFLNHNKHIDTILVSFYYSALTSNIDDGWICNENAIKGKIPHYLTLLDKKDIAIFADKKISLIKAILRPPYRLAFEFIVKKCNIAYEDLDIGKHVKIKWHKLQEDVTRNSNKQEMEETDISFYQREYLLKIIDLCKSRNVALILINTPTYKPEIYGNINKLNDYYNAYLSGVKYLDYSAFSLSDFCYGDIGHLNYKGVEIFSKYLQENFGQDVNSK